MRLKVMVLAFLTLLAFPLLVAGPSLAQLPDVYTVYLDETNINALEETGTINSVDYDILIEDGHADLSIVGTPGDCTICHPTSASLSEGTRCAMQEGRFPGEIDDTYMILRWNDQESFSVYFKVTAQDDSPFNFGVYFWKTGEQGYESFDFEDLGPDFTFGHEFPALDAIEFYVVLTESGGTYDHTFKFDWGEGTPVEPRSIGSVKALFR